MRVYFCVCACIAGFVSAAFPAKRGHCVHVNDHWIKLRPTLAIKINQHQLDLMPIHSDLKKITDKALCCLKKNRRIFPDRNNLCSVCFSCIVKQKNGGLEVNKGEPFRGSVPGSKPMFVYSSSSGQGDHDFVSRTVGVQIDTEGQTYNDSELQFLTDLLENDAAFLIEAPLSCLKVSRGSINDEALSSKLSSVVAVVLHIHSIQAPCGLCSALLVGLAKALAEQDHPLKKSLEAKVATYFGNDKRPESQPVCRFFNKLGSEKIPFLICISSDRPDGNCAFWVAADECTLAQFNGLTTPIEIKGFVPNVLWYSFEQASPAKLDVLASMLNDKKEITNLKKQCEEQKLQIQDLTSQVEGLRPPAGKSSVGLEVSDAVVIENIQTQEVSEQAGMPSDLEAEVAAPSADEVSESTKLSADESTEKVVGRDESPGSKNVVDDDNDRSPRRGDGEETENEEEESYGESSVERKNEEPGSGEEGCLLH